MSKYSALIKRATSATTALALSLASLSPAVMLGSRASAGQMTERQILMSNSALGGSSTYTVSFKPTLTTTIKRIVVDFCESSPIVNQDCADEMDTMVTPTTGTASVLLNGGAGQSFDITGTSNGSNEVILSSGTGRTISTANSDVVSFSFSVTNEAAGAGTFYARLVTYGSESAAYADNNIGSEIDGGGIALSTTNDVTISARIQEQLTFCVGATADHTTISSCTDQDWDGSTIDLGVLAYNSVATSPVAVVGTDGNNREGAFFVTTNAVGGVIVSYTSPNSLRVGSVACENTDTNVTDQCINASTTPGAISATTEGFGMSLTDIDDAVEDVAGETNLTAMNDYGTGYAWNTSSSVQIAQTTGVVVGDQAELTFKATPAATTPSGYYTTTANFVATAKF